MALLDTYNFARMERPTTVRAISARRSFSLWQLDAFAVEKLAGYFSNKLRVARDGELSSLWKALRSVFGPSDTGRTSDSIEASVQEVNDRAAEAYQPQPYAGSVTRLQTKSKL